MKPELIFIIDPMCSWCWGFHLVIQELREKHSDKYRYSLVVGGLRTKGQMAWTQESRDIAVFSFKASISFFISVCFIYTSFFFVILAYYSIR